MRLNAKSLLVIGLPLLLAACATAPQLAQENAALKQRVSELEEVVKERDVLLQEKQELRKEIDRLQGEIDEQLRRRKGIKAVLFDGDIIYEIDAVAYPSYREGLRFRSLRDAEFAASLADYEQGEGGDIELMQLLKEVDTTRDRFISSEEAEAFVSAEQQVFYGQEREKE